MGLLDAIRQRSLTLRDLFKFLWARKVWWMIPLVVLLLVFCALVFLATQSPVAPFIYTLF